MNSSERKVWRTPFCQVGLMIVLLTVVQVGCSDMKKPSERGTTAEVEYLEQSIVAATAQNPGHAPEWDGAIHDLAHRYAVSLKKNMIDYEMDKIAREAVSHGCRDPFVRYVMFRHRIGCMELNDEDFAREGLAITEEMLKGSYPALLRAYASWRSYLICDEVFPRDKERELRIRLSEYFWKATMDTLKDPKMPEWMARLVGSKLDLLWAPAKDKRDYVAKEIDAAFSVHYGDCASIHYLRGQRAINRAWEARGGGYADTVTSEGWITFERELKTAQKELEHSWQLAPNEPDTAEAMITVCLGLGLPREKMEQWFHRGLGTGQDISSLCRTKNYYLTARWHGSLDQQLEFSQECLTHPEYGWQTSLLLWETHQDHQSINNLSLSYFAQVEVWRDIRRSLSNYLELNPESVLYRMHYAYHAWLAKDWPILQAQLALLDPAKADFKKIGGRTVYDQMLADAQKHSEN